MALPGSKVVVGVSGGADSVCLLFVLTEYAKKVPLRLAVAHVNHGLRPDAREDAEFVRQLCRREGVAFFLKEVDVASFADMRRCSREEAGRLLRYAALREQAAAFGADYIAVAHNANDRAETMLFHLFRGSGLKGLCGIPPRREEIIRPLLCLERREIEAYLRDRGIPFRVDSTNLEDGYTRNRIRHHVIPYAENSVSARAVAHMCRTAELFSETEDYLELQTIETAAACVETETDGRREPLRAEEPACDEPYSGRFWINVARFLKIHPALQKRILLRLSRWLAPGGKDIAAVHVEDVLTLFGKEGNLSRDLPFGIRAVRRYEWVLLERGTKAEYDAQALKPLSVEIPRGTTEKPVVLDLGVYGQAEISVFFTKLEQKVPKNEYTKWFDCDKIMESPVFRCRQKGDYLSIADGQGGAVHKPLKKYMITEKIPREDRDRLLLLAEGSHVLWLAGYRISELYKVDGNTKRVLQVKLLRDCSGSGTEEENGRTH